MPMINHMPIPMLTHIPVPVLMNIKPVKKLKRKTMSESSDDEIEILHKPPPPALKRRRITYHTLDINIESDNHNNKSESYSDDDMSGSFIVDDNVIEYISDNNSDNNWKIPKLEKVPKLEETPAENTNNKIEKRNDIVNVNNSNKNMDSKSEVKKQMSEGIDVDNKDKNNEIEIEDECVVCMDKKKEYLCVPCGHLCVCVDCKDSVKQCPMCRKVSTTVIKLFK
eukprot:263082_1